MINSRTQAEMEVAVCETFAGSDPYLFAWIGTVDADAGTVTPRASGGVEQGYLDGIEITLGDDATAHGPSGRAAMTRQPQAAQNIPEDPAFEPWRESALERGYRSSAAFPLLLDDDLYGVLNLYADRVGAFDPDEMSLLATLAEDIAFAIDAHRNRAALELSEERLSLASEAANVGVWDWLVDADELIWDAQMERHFGLEPGTFEGRSEDFLRRVHPADREAVKSAIDVAIDAAGGFQSEFRVVRDDDTERWLLGLGEVVTDDAETPLRMVGVNIDVTERKDREQHLRVVDRVLRHNLRNAVNVISGHASLIEAATEGEVAESAATIIDQSASLLLLAEKERDIVEVLMATDDRANRPVAEVVRRAVEAMRTRHPDASIDYRVDAVTGQRTTARLGVAIRELIENAVVHNDAAEPVVTVGLAVEDGRPIVLVEDERPAIPEMNVGVLTGEGDIGPLYHGSGLGLWLVHWIVQRADGTLGFEQLESRGNRVTVRLPPVDTD
ncbi:MAG: GAF domain-containing protein [Halobacteriales archaeon]|nr:GAF domain-containing protein [Halobacteriales archaeon]